jgi:hypothetical protein
MNDVRIESGDVARDSLGQNPSLANVSLVSNSAGKDTGNQLSGAVVEMGVIEEEVTTLTKGVVAKRGPKLAVTLSEQLEPAEVAGLSATQRNVMEFLLAGESVAESARRAGLSRSTIFNWLKQDAVFRSLYNQWQSQMEEGAHGRLRRMSEKAADAVERALERNDAKTAMRLLEKLGMLKEREIGPTDPAEMREKMENEKKAKTIARRREKAKLGMEDSFVDFGLG